MHTCILAGRILLHDLTLINEDKMEFDKMDVVSDYKHLQIREKKEDGGYHRRVLTPGMDVSGETQTIQQGMDENADPVMKTVKEIAEGLWTDDIKQAWAAKQAQSTP